MQISKGGRSPYFGRRNRYFENQRVRELHDVEFQIPADRIAAGTYVCASAITRGEGVLLGAPIGEMEALLWAYGKIGGQYRYNSGKLTLHS